MNEIVISEIENLRGDIKTIRESSQSKWNMYFPIEALEVIMIKLLMKSEHYNLALDLFSSNKDIYIESGLAVEESEFFKKIISIIL